MKILKSDFKKGFAEIKIESLDDLWILSHIIDNNDVVSSKTTRKIKIGDEQDRNKRVSKKQFYLKIRVEDIKFHKYSNSLRISGKVIEEKQDISKGSYHTLDIEENSTLKIQKEKFLQYQIKKLKEASQQKRAKILICILERDQACFAIIKDYGYDYLGEIEGKVQKKAVEEKQTQSFYKEVIKKLEEYDKRYSLDHIILASPAFFKDDLMKELNSQIKNKITLATVNSFGKSGINEVLKRDEINKVMHHERITRETKLVEELLTEISKDNLAVYGIRETSKASKAGAIKTLLITDDIIHKYRQENKYEKVDGIMKTTDSSKGEVHIISTDHEAGKKLKGLGGIAAILRYKIN